MACAQDVPKAKQFLPFLQRAGKTEALVEFVASGSRLRLYIPKETCLITLLLSGDNLLTSILAAFLFSSHPLVLWTCPNTLLLHNNKMSSHFSIFVSLYVRVLICRIIT